MLVGRGKHFEEFAATEQSPVVESAQPQLVNSSSSLEVLLDSSLVLSFHIAASISKTNYHLQLAKRLHLILKNDETQLFMSLSPLGWTTAQQYSWA